MLYRLNKKEGLQITIQRSSINAGLNYAKWMACHTCLHHFGNPDSYRGRIILSAGGDEDFLLYIVADANTF